MLARITLYNVREPHQKLRKGIKKIFQSLRVVKSRPNIPRKHMHVKYWYVVQLLTSSSINQSIIFYEMPSYYVWEDEHLMLGEKKEKKGKDNEYQN